MRRSGGGLAAITVAALMAVPGGAGAGSGAPGWSRPVVVASTDGYATLGGAIRADGSLRLALEEDAKHVQLAFSDGTGAPAKPVLAGPDPVFDIGFAADGSGLALLAGPRRDDPSHVVAFGADGAVDARSLLQVPGRAFDLAVARSGAAVMAWSVRGAHGAEVDAAFRAPGAAFGPVRRAGYATTTDLIVNAGIGDAGAAVVSWQENYFPSRLSAAVRPAGASGFAPATTVSTGATDGRLAVGPGGQAILSAPHDRSLGVSVKAPGATSMPPESIVDRAREPGSAGDVAAAGTQGVGVAWDAGPRIRVLAGTAARGLRVIGSVGREPAGEDLKLALAPSGAAVLAWEEALKPKHGDPTARSHLAIARRPAGGRFGAPVFRGPVALDDTPLLALVQGSRAYVAYEAFQSSNTESYRRVYVTESGR